jgi:hypothetical protein
LSQAGFKSGNLWRINFLLTDEFGLLKAHQESLPCRFADHDRIWCAHTSRQLANFEAKWAFIEEIDFSALFVVPSFGGYFILGVTLRRNFIMSLFGRKFQQHRIAFNSKSASLAAAIEQRYRTSGLIVLSVD